MVDAATGQQVSDEQLAECESEVRHRLKLCVSSDGITDAQWELSLVVDLRAAREENQRLRDRIADALSVIAAHEVENDHRRVAYQQLLSVTRLYRIKCALGGSSY